MEDTIKNAAAIARDENNQEACILSETDSILATLKPIAKYKARSHETSKNTHIPRLESHTKNYTENGPTVVLLGDSMLERMITTGQSPNFVAPWPSPALLDDDTWAQYQPDSDEFPAFPRLDRVFNAGVGGDKIQNVAYRLVGDEERELPGLLPLLARCGTVRVWVVHVGTNNLSPKHGLRNEDVRALEVLLTALLRASARSRVILTALFPRTDMPANIIEQADQEMKGMSNLLEDGVGIGRVFFAGRQLGFKMGEHLEDHVHLNLEGYRSWAELLWMRVSADLLSSDREVRS
ncbi:hypothetical protein N658DRAFT_429118 [Parathielavia hyrcaniae]|uniref:SGNH hydrolase-type esterase domain-containing protein n=1 Tax=Parathielavia hyrcaniae TaxID=113614 RepID=A0AAN6Q2M4_9PEZI|nr:hypothetical protein N658DRAFT_429118 [Parathielavia hyrcaniae]